MAYLNYMNITFKTHHFIGSPTSKLSINISISVQKTVRQNEFYIVDSWSFKHKINNISIPKNSTIISLDIVSMFTNITWDLKTKSIKKRWNVIKQHTFFNDREFNRTLKICLDSLSAPHLAQTKSVCSEFSTRDPQ